MKEKYLAYLRHYLQMIVPPLAIFSVAIVMFISLWSFRAHDISWLYHAHQGTCQNTLGYFGSTLAAVLIYLFGSVAYLIPVIMMYSLLFIMKYQRLEQELDKIFGIVVGFVVACMLFAYHHVGYHDYSPCGGVLGGYGLGLLKSFDWVAQGIVLYVLMTFASILVVRFAHLRAARYIVVAVAWFGAYLFQVNNFPAKMVRGCASVLAWFFMAMARLCVWSYRVVRGVMVQQSTSSIVQFEREDQSVDIEIEQLLATLRSHSSAISSQEYEEPGVSQPMDVAEVSSSMVQTSEQTVKTEKIVAKKSYSLPDIEKMLSHGNYRQSSDTNTQELVEQAAILEEKLSLFGVKGKVVRAHPGPVITLFEYKPDIRIKLSKILGLEDDLAMALQALSIRILAPIPGKDVVGFEVSNKNRKSVFLSDIFHSTSWTKFKGSLPLILGEDTSGQHVVVDLASMPHVLIAGSTGSGKSVALNCMLVSLLCAKKPEQLKLIIIDPKQIEFTAYERIAHLLFPVVNDPKKALPILKWLVMTMEQRYDRMAELGVKNIFEHHKLEEQRSDLEHMPFIVVMIDELADLMMTTGKEIEGMIARIAQMSRAAGIHMIVATQRPSVDVITGLIKVNFPNRISFKVTSKVDSRTILDEMGAERLLGKGDMLFIDAKDPHIRRVHGAYVSDKEISYLVSHIEAQQPPKFLDISDYFVSEQQDDSLHDTDQDLYDQVVDMLQECDEVSISLIQRRFRIGFNRSARIIETLEARGLIMSTDGGKMRRVVKD